MGKKFICLAIAVMLWVFGLVGCVDSLADYKTTKQIELQAYADTKERGDYTEANWSALQLAVTEGKKMIEDASTKAAVTMAYNDTKDVIDAIQDRKVSDLMKSGAYFITDASWELYIRNWAVDIQGLIGGIDEAWVQRAIEGALTVEDTQGLFLPPPNRSRMWVAAYGDKLTANQEVYSFVRKGDTYIGERLNSIISFILLGDILTINKGNSITQYKLDESYQLSENRPVQFTAPAGIRYNHGGQGLNYISFDWNPNPGSGWFGAGIEIKKAGSVDYSLVKIDYAYNNTFVVQFNSTDLLQGLNSIRINYIGGPSLDRRSKLVYLIPSSEYTTFTLTVCADGSVKVE